MFVSGSRAGARSSRRSTRSSRWWWTPLSSECASPSCAIYELTVERLGGELAGRLRVRRRHRAQLRCRARARLGRRPVRGHRPAINAIEAALKRARGSPQVAPSKRATVCLSARAAPNPGGSGSSPTRSTTMRRPRGEHGPGPRVRARSSSSAKTRSTSRALALAPGRSQAAIASRLVLEQQRGAAHPERPPRRAGPAGLRRRRLAPQRQGGVDRSSWGATRSNCPVAAAPNSASRSEKC